ncbi:MAG: hypothetical protein J5867_10545 [Prevotella sp.]|nr:hypothetical protein [Prevotella sp.]
MKKGAWIFLLALLVSCVTEMSEDDKAATLLSQIDSLYNKGEYRATLDSIESLRMKFPRAIHSRKRALHIWQEASLKMAQADIASTDSALQVVTRMIGQESNIYKRNMMGVKRDSLKARYEAMCGVVRMIRLRQKESK